LGRAGYVFDPGMVEHDQAGLASDGWAAIFFVFNEYNFSRKVGTGDFRKY
jgi:hypothetical protein